MKPGQVFLQAKLAVPRLLDQLDGLQAGRSHHRAQAPDLSFDEVTCVSCPAGGAQSLDVGKCLVGADVDPLVRRGRPVLEQLASELGEAANLAIARRFDLVYVDQVDPPHVMAPNWYGRAVPLHATSTGKAYLAYLPDDEQEAVLPRRLERYTETTVTDRRTLGEQLAAVRRDGYAICVGELEESLFGASAPVLSEQGRPVAIVSVWGTEHRLPRERLPEVGRRVVEAAEELKELLR